MVNTRKKGSKNELRAVKELEQNGWLVYRVKGSTKFNLCVDIFNLFDIVAKKGKTTKWLQIKTNKKPKLDEFHEFKKLYCSPFEEVEIWCYVDYKGVKKYSV